MCVCARERVLLCLLCFGSSSVRFDLVSCVCVCVFSSPALQRPALDAVHCSLRLLASSASRLQVECRKAAPSDPSAPAVDYQLLTQQVIQCAYEIGRAHV